MMRQAVLNAIYPRFQCQSTRQTARLRLAWWLLLIASLYAAVQLLAAAAPSHTHIFQPGNLTTNSSLNIQESQTFRSLRQDGLQGNTSPVTAAAAQATLSRYFPQFSKQCRKDNWTQHYQQLHRKIVSGAVPPYYLTSLAVEKGLADRITGLVTQFYLALLSQRALTLVTYGRLPAFEAICDMPHINWTNPFQYPDAALEPLKWSFPGAHPLSPESRSYPAQGPVNSSTYYPMYLINQGLKAKPCLLCNLSRADLSVYPPESPSIRYVISALNRGQTYQMMQNPHHKDKLQEHGLTPENAFMCGLFFLCAPSAAVQRLQMQYWESMQRSDVLRIAISVRTGDSVFSRRPDALPRRGTMRKLQETPAPSMDMILLDRFTAYFECARKVEQAFVRPGQDVLWYLISDSTALRKAAKERYGDKLLTDTKTRVVHTARNDCEKWGTCKEHANNPEMAMQHAFGEMLTFSMADYHIYTARSGFGRLGAWMSGDPSHMYQIEASDVDCDPYAPTPPRVSASKWSKI